MVEPLVPRRTQGERAVGRPQTALESFVRAARGTAARSGHHNLNHVRPLTEDVARLVGRPPGTQVTVRIRRPDVLPVVIRTWQDEAAVLRAVGSVLPAPECLVRTPEFALHSYVEGVPLSSVNGDGKPVDTLLVQALADLLARMTQVRRAVLPPLPPEWPANHTDSQAFLRTLAHLADRQIRKPNWPVFGGLFKALGIPDDALSDLADRVPSLARRPYSLLHTDLHRANVILAYDGEPPLICVDWELATFGDPLHDLATHLVRMHYPADQWDEVIQAWLTAMQRTRPAAVNGLARDLPHYLDFEWAQSVYPDVMRAASSLLESCTGKRLDEATTEVHRALETAAGPLRLSSVPAKSEIERALVRWLASQGEGRGDGWIRNALGWRPDPRVPEDRGFPARAVREALLAEGAAPADRVFKGTAHLNTVVRLPGVAPVVVRRKLPGVSRREPKYLSEHAVLQAIHECGAEVAAPRVLALGESHGDDPFAIQTYVGGTDIDQRPRHPVDGLLPHEADGLVDQLCALTRVDCKRVDPTAGEGGFYPWLVDELVHLVRTLPNESSQLARTLGLPDHDRLRELLSRHQVAHRRPSLLHGDLNPWNLVRRDDRIGVTIIDWEMAIVGDPLYDLVRHIHLTPTRREIRDRMFRRWESRLPPECTRDWRRDRRVYRWFELVRSAYIDLDRLVTGSGMDAPNVRRAVDSYAQTLAAATAALGLPVPRTANPHLAVAFA
ncbi:aminoglycoside phosphotransferase family protein [Streptomyces galbus]|uniref:Aminoglycoside phosphotransferase family protein n=1 Tax=Streptomyces galbus TaxID=33898 RepID=A0ABX1IEI0_STRGB|nr:aminoglycoside phosphotransferase family protein [Streptomyces galbus]NKQ23819.1 aminoglycoside phosphotransferase family protein [Streptomyces galbus]